MRGAQIAPYGLRGRGPYDGQLLVERRGGGRGPGRQEVGQGERRTDQGGQQGQVGGGEGGEGGAAPAAVQGVQSRGAQDAQALHQFAERGDGEAGVGEVVDPEPEADHLAPVYIVRQRPPQGVDFGT